jgi:hypothetical protein
VGWRWRWRRGITVCYLENRDFFDLEICRPCENALGVGTAITVDDKMLQKHGPDLELHIIAWCFSSVFNGNLLARMLRGLFSMKTKLFQLFSACALEENPRQPEFHLSETAEDASIRVQKITFRMFVWASHRR